MCCSPGRGKESDTTERLDYGNKRGGGCELNGAGLQSGETKVPHGGGHPTASTPSAPEPCTCKQSQG